MPKYCVPMWETGTVHSHACSLLHINFNFWFTKKRQNHTPPCVAYSSYVGPPTLLFCVFVFVFSLAFVDARSLIDVAG